MSDSPYVPFYTSDFLGGTSGMTAATKGVYITLLCQMYEAEKPLAQGWDTLARRCGCTLPTFKRAVETLEDDGKLTISEDGIWSDKCDKHLTLRRDRSDSAKAAAKKRWQKDKQNQRKGDATASMAQCQPEPEPKDTTYPLGGVSKETSKARKKPSKSLTDDWAPDMDQARSLMEEFNISREDMNFCYQQMKGHANATDRKQANWNAAFGNWVRKDVKDGRVGPKSNGKQAGSSMWD